MIAHVPAVGEDRLALARVRRWALWSAPRPARAFILVVEALAGAGSILLLVGERPTMTIGLRCAALVVLTVGYAELAKRSERIRRYLGAGQAAPRPNPLSVWSFAAVLVLPAGWAALVVGVQYAHALVQRRRDRSGTAYRVLFTAAAAIVAQLAAAAVLDEPAPGGALHGHLMPAVSVLAGAVVFTVVDMAIVLGGMWLALRPPNLRKMLPDNDALGYELATLVLGMTVAEILLHTPVLVAVMVVPTAYLHRSAMVKSLHQASRTDSKTGLLNSTAWAEHARAVIARADRPAAIVVLDVDHFKAINDTQGHLVGDAVLAAVAGVLEHELRGHDGIGRFGGDEFVIVLDDLDPAQVELVAARLHSAISRIEVGDGVRPSVSMGVAHTATHRADYTTLLAAADAALYAAKADGRGRLSVAGRP